jgi:hypothetical protein
MMNRQQPPGKIGARELKLQCCVSPYLFVYGLHTLNSEGQHRSYRSFQINHNSSRASGSGLSSSTIDPSGLIFSSAEPFESVVCFSFSGVSPEVESALLVLSLLVSDSFFLGFGLGILLTLATYVKHQSNIT